MEALNQEEMVLGNLRDLRESMRRKSIGEDEYHMMHSTMDSIRKGLGFKYKLTHWGHIDERLISRFGAVPYSSRLHEIIERLVEKGLVKRNPDNPIEISYSGN